MVMSLLFHTSAHHYRKSTQLAIWKNRNSSCALKVGTPINTLMCKQVSLLRRLTEVRTPFNCQMDAAYLGLSLQLPQGLEFVSCPIL